MSLATTNEWYVFDGSALDKKTCSKIKNWAKDKWRPSAVDTSKSTTDEERKTGKKRVFEPDSRFRISDVAWCNDQWLYDIIWPFMMTANDKAGWKFNIKSAESCQITRYKKGGFYKFHKDGMADYLSAYNFPENEFLHGQVRKLSMSVILNDNFEGGEFEFATYDKQECEIHPIEASAGSVIVFPSGMEHRVSPVTKGTRYSVVCWFVGPPIV